MYGSDWPNSDPLGTYPQVLKIVEEYFHAKGTAAAENYFWRNSIAAYRWIKRDARQPGPHRRDTTISLPLLAALASCARLLAAVFLCLAPLCTGCGRSRPPDIAADIARIRAIDNHAHPVRVVGPGEQDREFDALPVDNMEPSSDPVYLRPGAPGILEAWRALFGYSYNDLRPEHARELPSLKRRAMQREGDGYPAWVLDRMGVEVMLANRVRMGRGIASAPFPVGALCRRAAVSSGQYATRRPELRSQSVLRGRRHAIAELPERCGTDWPASHPGRVSYPCRDPHARAAQARRRRGREVRGRLFALARIR
jgi:hypothetical protein